jgi:hypothetical protein
LLFSSYSEVDVETDVHEITEIPTELDASLQETSLEQQAAAAIETDNGSLLGATHNTSVTLRGAKCEGHIYRVYYRKVQMPMEVFPWKQKKNDDGRLSVQGFVPLLTI